MLDINDKMVVGKREKQVLSLVIFFLVSFLVVFFAIARHENYVSNKSEGLPWIETSVYHIDQEHIIDENETSIENVGERKSESEKSFSRCVDGSDVRGGILIDIRDGNNYETVKIGDQCWMAENLAYLPEVHSASEFREKGEDRKPAYGVYDYDFPDLSLAKSSYNYTTYGVLYNWYAINQESLCPRGWHVPTEIEKQILANYLSTDDCDPFKLDIYSCSPAGKRLRDSKTWCLESDDCNSSGFTALAGGMRSSKGMFSSLGHIAYFWFATSSPSDESAFSWLLSGYNDGVVFSSSYDLMNGHSVRCVRD